MAPIRNPASGVARLIKGQLPLNNYVLAGVFGAVVFFVQLVLVAEPQLSVMSPKSSALAGQALLASISSPRMLAVLLGYAAIGTFAHVLPMLLTAKVFTDLEAHGSARFRRLFAKPGAFGISLLGMLMLLIIANNAVFPVSLTFPSSNLLLIQKASPLLVYGLPLIYLATAVYWFAAVASSRVKVLGLGASILALAAWTTPFGTPVAAPRADLRPDLIVIGVDSLRPDHLQSGRSDETPLTPTIDSFVSNSVNFKDAFTPQARTFVAYMSILSGQYPSRHAARENLYPDRLFDKRLSVAHRLRRDGYSTILAMDEARFANFDHGFGFDATATPPPGIADFLVGGLLDTVGTNLLQLVPHAGRVLPHVAGNRAASSTYVPRVHSDKLARTLRGVAAEKPLFLVSHFCMAHVPYARGAAPLAPPHESIADSPNGYRAALAIVDRQVKDLLAQLRASGRLNNAVVVVLSDHGESLGMAKDRWELIRIDGSIEQPVVHGHGSPALDESQSKVLLSIQRFRDGSPVWRPRDVSHGVSLVDVVPTLLRVSGAPYRTRDFDGIALLDPNGVPLPLSPRALFVESGISGSSLQRAQVDPGEVANEFNYLYEVTDDLRFELSPNELAPQLRQKQRGMVMGRFGLSSWPAPDGTGEGCWLKLHRETRQARCLAPDTSDRVVRAYRPLLCAHYSGDREFFSQWCRPGSGRAQGAVGRF